MAPNESINRFGNMFLPCLLTSTQSTSGWTVHETNLVLDGHTLTEISAFCSRPDNLTEETNTLDYFALLGHISIKSQQKTKLFPLASSWVIEAHHVKFVPGDSGSKSLSCKLEWRLKHPEEDSVFTKYNVYAENLSSSDYRPRKVLEEPRSEKVFLGTAHVDAYYVSDLVVGSDVKGVRFVVQTCGEDVVGETNVPVIWTKHLLKAADQAQFLAPATPPDFYFCIAATASLDLGPAH